MRLVVGYMATALIVFGALSANAATITLSGLPAGPIAVNDTFTITLTADFTDQTCSSCVVQLNFSTLLGTAGVLDVVGGASAAQIFGWEFAPGNFFGGVSLVPGFVPNNNLDPAVVRSGSWLGLSPGGHVNGDWAPVLATVTFRAIGAGSTTMAPGFGQGDLYQTSAGDASGAVTFLGGGAVVVPEPTTAVLVGLGLVGLGLAGRKR